MLTGKGKKEVEILEELFSERPDLLAKLDNASQEVRDIKSEIFSELQRRNKDIKIKWDAEADQTKSGGTYLVWCDPHGYVDLVPGVLLGEALQKHSETQGPHSMRTENIPILNDPI